MSRLGYGFHCGCRDGADEAANNNLGKSVRLNIGRESLSLCEHLIDRFSLVLGNVRGEGLAERAADAERAFHAGEPSQ